MLCTLPLPLELIESIIDFAEYWPCTYTEMREPVAVLSNEAVRIMNFYSMNIAYHHWILKAVRETKLLRTGPLGFGYPALKKLWEAPWSDRMTRRPDSIPQGQSTLCPIPLPTRGIRPCRKIVFSIISRGECRSDAAAASLFDAALDKTVPGPHSVGNRPDPALPSTGAQDVEPTKPPSIQSNILKALRFVWQLPITNLSKGLANTKKSHGTPLSDHLSWQCVSYNELDSRMTKHRIITWRYDDDSTEQADDHNGAKFVRSMELGDSIILCARPRGLFAPGMLYVSNASVCVYWAV